MKLWLLALLLLCVPSTALAQEEIPDAVVLGFNPAENTETLQRSADELAHALSDRIHLPVRASVTLDYTTLVESMRSGHVHVAWLTPSPLVLAERLIGVDILLTQVRRGSPTYFAALVVRSDSRFHTIEDLRGGSIAWIDPTSTSGYVIPRYMLLERGINPSGFFARQVFAGQHDAAVIAVQRGQIDAAAVWADPPDEHTGAWTRYLRNHPNPTLRPILYSPPVPSDAVAVTHEFARTHPILVRNLTSALVAIGQTEEGRAILGRLNHTDGFVQADPARYDLVRRAFRATREERSSAQSGRFEHPRDVAVFALLVVAIAATALARKRQEKVVRWVAAALFVVAFFWSADAARLPWREFLKGFGAMANFVRGMFPPDARVATEVLEATILTMRLALVGTVLGVPFALILGLLAAENVNPIGWLRTTARMAANLNRSVDLLIVGLVLVSAYGPGAFPGVGALAIHTVGSLGKQFYETLETMDPGPVEAMRSVGGTRLQVIRWGIWPQFTAHFVSQALFRFELNVRGAVVLGLVGAQGIGFLLQTYMRGAEYAKVTVVIVAIVLLVMALDAISSRLRRDAR